MKKIVLSVAVALVAGVGGIFVFSGCGELNWQECVSNPKAKDLCLYYCKENTQTLESSPQYEQAKKWCEANGVKID